MYRTLQKPTPTGKIELQERDILWLRAVHRFRFMTTDQAQILSGSTSRRKLNDRLATLWAHDFLDRPRVQLEAFSRKQKRHTVHALGQRGAEWLRDNDGQTFPKGKGWNTANKLKSAERMMHQIGIADTVIMMERTIAATPQFSITHQDELISEVDWEPGLRSYRLPTKVMEKGRTVERATDPDYTFSLNLHSETEKTRRALFFLEWDNATEDFMKASSVASSIRQKLLCYADAYRRKLPLELYGHKGWRLLFVVNDGEARVEKMLETQQRVLGNALPSNVVWYTTQTALESRGVLADIWRTTEGDKLTLV